jgi:hypothetical protein
MSDSRAQFVKDSLEFSAEFDSLQQERNKRREMERGLQMRTRAGGMMGSHGDHHHQRRAEQEQGNAASGGEETELRRGNGSYRPPTSPPRHSQRQPQQQLSPEVGRYHDQGEWEDEEGGREREEGAREVQQQEEEEEEEGSQGYSHSYEDRERGRRYHRDDKRLLERHGFQEEWNEEVEGEEDLPYRQSSAAIGGMGRQQPPLGVEELTLVNESLMASLQFEREAKERLLTENRALEVSLIAAPPLTSPPPSGRDSRSKDQSRCSRRGPQGDPTPPPASLFG